MNWSRTVRAWFVSTLVTVGCGVACLTGWLVWPAFYESWTVRPLIEKLKVATIEGDVQTDSDVRDKLLEIGSPALPALLDLLKDPNAEFRQAACLALSDFRIIPT